jgi:SAM-dependent methyltransferase
MTKSYNYDEIPAGYYDKIYRRKKGAQSAWHFNKFTFVSELLPVGGKHLDIGCGPGTFLGGFGEKFEFCCGVDISAQQIIYAKNSYPKVTFEVTNGLLPFEDNSFDSITLIELIEHIDQSGIDNLLKEAHRCLKPSGIIVITTPNYLSFWPAIEYFVNLISPLSYEDQHISKFNINNLSSKVRSNRLRKIRAGTFNFLSPFLAFFSWRLFLFTSNLEKRINCFGIGNLLYIVAEKDD